MEISHQIATSCCLVVLLLLDCAGLTIAFSPATSIIVCLRHARQLHTKHHIKSFSQKHSQYRKNPISNINYRMKDKFIFTALNSLSKHDQESKVVGVTLKMAFDESSVWGVAEKSPTSERFTSPESLDMVHRLRRESSAVLVGRGTVERDDCSLTVRRVEMDGDQPVRVVVDPRLKILQEKKKYTLLNDGLPTIIYHAVSNSGIAVESSYTCSDAVTLVEMKQQLVSGSVDSSEQQYALSPTDIINDLLLRGLKHVMVEGGPATAIQFLDSKLVDRAILVRAPIQFKAPIPAGFNKEKLKQAGLVMIGSEIMGGDTVEYWVREGMEWPTKDLTLWP